MRLVMQMVVGGGDSAAEPLSISPTSPGRAAELGIPFFLFQPSVPAAGFSPYGLGGWVPAGEPDHLFEYKNEMEDAWERTHSTPVTSTHTLSGVRDGYGPHGRALSPLIRVPLSPPFALRI